MPQPLRRWVPPDKKRLWMQEIDSIGYFDAKKSEPLFWWQSQKHRTICFGVSFLQVYWETRISKILSMHLWIVGPETVLIWPVMVWSGIAQWRLRVPNRLFKSPILVSQAQWAEKHFHYGHRERGGTVAISNYPPNESLFFPARNLSFPATSDEIVRCHPP